MDNWEHGKLNEDETPKKRPGWNKAKAYQGQAIAAFLTIGAALLLYFFLLRFSKFTNILKLCIKALSPFITGFVFAFIMNPLVKFMEQYFVKLFCKKAKTDEDMEKGRGRARKISIFLTLLIVIAAIALLIGSVIPEFFESIKTLVTNLPDYANSLLDSIKNFLSRNQKISDIVTPHLEKLTTYTENFLENYLGTITGTGAKWVAAGVSVAFSIVYNLFIGIIVAVYMLGKKEYYIGMIKKAVFALFPKKGAKTTVEVFHQANFVFSSAILGKMLDSVIIGLICFVGTSILGIAFSAINEYKILVSVIVGVTNVIPFFGPYIGGIPSVVLIMCLNPVHGLIFGAFLIVLQQFDCNFLDPRIVGQKVGLRPIFVLLACTFLGSLFGIIGMMIATPTFAMIYSLLKTGLEARLEKNNLPTDTWAYANTPGAYLANGRPQTDADFDGMPDELEDSLDFDENGIPDGEDRKAAEAAASAAVKENAAASAAVKSAKPQANGKKKK